MLLSRRIALFAGKGGVGKTTLATAAATLRAASGARTLLVSTDPAHSTGDLLGVPLGPEPRAVGERLDAVEVDAAAEAAAYVARIKADADAALPPEVRAAVHRQLDLAVTGPGTLESAAFDRVVDLLDDPVYDAVVVDTAPTGHTLRLLALPDALGGWLDALVRRREQVGDADRLARALAGTREDPPDPLLDRLRARRGRLAAAARRLRDDAAVVLVVVPERLPIAETVRARAALEEAGLTVGPVVVNRVLPADADGAFLRDRAVQQAVYLDEIAAAFGDLPLVAVPQGRRDVADPDGVAAVAAQLRAASPDAAASDAPSSGSAARERLGRTHRSILGR